jgi:hypothetical protein
LQAGSKNLAPNDLPQLRELEFKKIYLEKGLPNAVKGKNGGDMGARGVRFIESEEDDTVILGCQYPEGSNEAVLEARANELLREYELRARKSAGAIPYEIDCEALKQDLMTENYDFGNEVFVPTMSSAESRRMTERFAAATSIEELAELVREYGSSPAARKLSVSCMMKRGWNTNSDVAKFRYCLAV